MKPIPKPVEPTLLPGLDLAGRGKVCELYNLPGFPGLRLKVISDRASVHDIILPFHVPRKGEVLNRIDLFWRSCFPDVKSDVIAAGAAIDEYLPEPLRGNTDLYRRARIIGACRPIRAELIYRSLLTGTGWKAYKNNHGVICGQEFPQGLREWDELSPPAFTPTTKAEDGHDVHMTVHEFYERFGRPPEEITRPVFENGTRIAAERGVIIADTKFEVGADAVNRLILIDEVLTPDSSRFLRPEDVAEARRTGKRPPSFDKQPIRDYVSEVLGVNADTPLTDEVTAKVHSHKFPEELIRETSDRYVQLLKLLPGESPNKRAATVV